MSDQKYHQALTANRKLLAEVARLKAEVERLRAGSFVTAVPSEHYERVIKAGDAMALSVGANWAINGPDDGTEPESVRAWNAAKEGRPNE